jgi:hypothetical protein
MGIIWTIIIGFLAGLIARWTHPGVSNEPSGFVLAAQIDKELHNQRHERFVDKLSLADICASLEYAANVLEQNGRRPVENTPASVEEGSLTRGRQRRR